MHITRNKLHFQPNKDDHDLEMSYEHRYTTLKIIKHYKCTFPVFVCVIMSKLRYSYTANDCVDSTRLDSNGYYDPDGGGNMTSFPVECDGPEVVIHHNHESRTDANGFGPLVRNRHTLCHPGGRKYDYYSCALCIDQVTYINSKIVRQP